MAKRKSKRGVTTTIVVPKWQRDLARTRRQIAGQLRSLFTFIGIIVVLVLMARWVLG
jgi:hypothetical protein